VCGCRGDRPRFGHDLSCRCAVVSLPVGVCTVRDRGKARIDGVFPVRRVVSEVSGTDASKSAGTQASGHPRPKGGARTTRGAVLSHPEGHHPPHRRQRSPICIDRCDPSVRYASPVGRISRHYEREAGDWIKAIVTFAVLLPLLIVLAIGATVVLVWVAVGGIVWLVGWPVSFASETEGQKLRASGTRIAEAAQGTARDLLNMRQARERKAREAVQARELAERPAREQVAKEHEQQRLAAQRQWLEGPPPTLVVPRRFSEEWFAVNVPNLHPGQLPTLLDELRARGWTDTRITQRLTRYVSQNPFIGRAGSVRED